MPHTVTAPAAVRLALPHHPAPCAATAWQATAGIVAAFATPRNPGETRAPTVLHDNPDPTTLVTDVSPTEPSGTATSRSSKLTEAAVREHARSHDTTLLFAATPTEPNVPDSQGPDSKKHPMETTADRRATTLAT
jgi:hypothetical protein